MRMESRATNLQAGEAKMTLSVFSWILRLAAAGILLQTLFFKFTAAPESVYIFTKVGLEPWGRIGSDVVELSAALLILSPGLTWLGSAIAIGVMAGAIISHLTLLGIEVQGHKGLLFALAVVFVAAINLFLHRTEIPFIGRKPA